MRAGRKACTRLQPALNLQACVACLCLLHQMVGGGQGSRVHMYRAGMRLYSTLHSPHATT